MNTTKTESPTKPAVYTWRDRIRCALGYGRVTEDSAKYIAGWIMEEFAPDRVLDVGCGGGAILREFGKRGAYTIGLDISPIQPAGCHNYRQVDLRRCSEFMFPTANVTICAEVAEHLPASVAGTLVSRLVESAPVVVFGAGIPVQGGFGHVNEQWPSYWAAMFADWGYHPHDDLRRHLWGLPAAPWYAQDLLVYCGSSKARSRGLRGADPLDVVHPGSWSRIGPMGIWQRVKRAMSTKGKS